MQAPRIAVLRILERMIGGDQSPSVERLGADLPTAVIAAMAEQLETVLARSVSCYKPSKVGIPSEGPWRAAVREHLGAACGWELGQLDTTARRAHAVFFESAVFANPSHDPSHRHAPGTDAVEAGYQMPTDPELGTEPERGEAARQAPPWIVREFEETLGEVNERIAHVGLGDPLVSLRSMLQRIDNLSEGASPAQLDQASMFLGVELERKSRQPVRTDRMPLPSLDELLEGACVREMAYEREIGGRSL
jgi:hypothetical protein